MCITGSLEVTGVYLSREVRQQDLVGRPVFRGPLTRPLFPEGGYGAKSKKKSEKKDTFSDSVKKKRKYCPLINNLYKGYLRNNIARYA